MKYAAQTHKGDSYAYDTFDKVMSYFSKKMVKNKTVKEAKALLHDFGNYIEKSDFPCNRIVLNCFTGFQDKFGLELQYNKEKIAYAMIEVKSYNILTLSHIFYEKRDFAIFNNIIEKYFDQYNKNIYNDWYGKCEGLKNDDNIIEINNYLDYKLTGTTELRGTIEDIFNQFTTINDRYKYCNGHYIAFKDKYIEVLYNIFVLSYNGNFSLKNAINRGVTID